MRRLTHQGLPELRLPAGYALRPYRTGDDGIWADLINRAGDLGEWDTAKVHEKLTGLPQFHPEGLLFVTTDKGTAVATACAYLEDADDWRSGRLHMVAVVPEHRGRRLSCWATLAVCTVFRRWGVPAVHLTTDEYRLAAVKVYVNLGFRPVFRTPDHYGRWIALYETYELTELAEGVRRQKSAAGY